jgi:hypothetical protein
MLGLEPYYRAFWALTGSRPVGFGAGPIAWSEVEAYGRARRFGWEQREDLHHYVSAMDGAYLAHVAKQKPRSNDGQAQPGKLRAKHAKARGGHRARGG